MAGAREGRFRRQRPHTVLIVSIILIANILRSSNGLSTSIINAGHGHLQRTARGTTVGLAAGEQIDDYTKRIPHKYGIKIERPRIPVLVYRRTWACVNKPAGITVHRSAQSRGHQFVLSTLLKRQFSRKVFPVHRLDHRTSGAILFAFDSETCGKIQKSLTSEDAKKVYVALVRGDRSDISDENDAVFVDKPLLVKGILKEARTKFTFLASLTVSGHGCSLVLCEPETGRTHQIRRHAKAMGHPILGDTEHGDTKVNRYWRNAYGLNRLALHCLSLDLPPLSNGATTAGDGVTRGEDEERICCVAPLPTELSYVLKCDDFQELWKEAVEKEPRLNIEPVDYRGGTLGRRGKRLLDEIDSKDNAV